MVDQDIMCRTTTRTRFVWFEQNINIKLYLIWGIAKDENYHDSKLGFYQNTNETIWQIPQWF